VFGQGAIAAAGKDEHGRAGVLGGVGGKRREGGYVLDALPECARGLAFPQADRTRHKGIGHGGGGAGRFFGRTKGDVKNQRQEGEAGEAAEAHRVEEL
jgi:hypothetical protein